MLMGIVALIIKPNVENSLGIAPLLFYEGGPAAIRESPPAVLASRAILLLLLLYCSDFGQTRGLVMDPCIPVLR